MVLPSPSTSRLTALRNARNSRSRQQPQQQIGIGEFLKRTNPLPMSVRRAPQQSSSQQQRAPVLSESQNNTPVHGDKILNGVVACLDVRTEDGDDVSQNFERALQSMGAKTRRTFSDSVTHLVFKNGSPATLKKAMSKNIFIINLLWISNCKREGKKVAEHEYMIDKPQGLLVTSGKKRRKSMEPGKVRALVMEELLQPTLSSSSDGSGSEEQDSRRKTIATCSWKARDFNSRERKEIGKRPRPDFEDEDPLKGLAAEIKLNPPRLSLPISVESIANKHNNNGNLSHNLIPIHAPSIEKKEQIKARFSIGNSSTAKEFPPIKIGTTPIAVCSGASPLRRRRKLTGNLPKAPITNTSIKDISITPSPKLERKYTIVLTSLSATIRRQCEDAIKKLGKYELATEVTENTTHVLVGVKRRTKTATFGLLRGVWMLKPEWLIQSALKNEYISEEDYELSDWYPRIEFARNHIPLLPFTTNIHIASSSSGLEMVEQMINLAGGCVVKNIEQANIVISDTPIKGIDKIVVNDTWLFDSIEQWKYISTNAYTFNEN